MAALADLNVTAVAKLHALQEAARIRNIELSIHQVAKGEEIVEAIDGAKASGATALTVSASPVLWANRRLIVDRVAAQGLPTIYGFPNGGDGRFHRLRAARRSALSGGSGPAASRALPRHESCTHSGRTADQVRIGNQPQDRESARDRNSGIILSSR